MKPEPSPLTKRQEWSNFSNEVQSDVEDTLAQLQVEIEYANTRLAELYNSDPEAAGEYATEMIEFLDKEWGYNDCLFMVTGTWHFPVVGYDGETVKVVQSVGPAFSTCRSNGFIVKPIEMDDGEELPRIGMSFKFPPISISTPSFQGILEPLAFAELNTISLQFMRPGTLEVVSSDPDEIRAAAAHADTLLGHHIKNPDSDFYKQSAKEQEEFFQGIFDIVENSLPDPSALDYAYIYDVIPQAIYFKDKDGLRAAVATGTQKPVITGRILGTSTVDIWKDGFGKQYKNPVELSAVASGLCYIVELHSANFPIGDSMRQALVPIRALGPSYTLSVQ